MMALQDPPDGIDISACWDRVLQGGRIRPCMFVMFIERKRRAFWTLWAPRWAGVWHSLVSYNNTDLPKDLPYRIPQDVGRW